MDVVIHALKIAKENNVTTILNPAPAAKLDPSVFPLIDYFTPNESEASFYVSGILQIKMMRNNTDKNSLILVLKTY